MLKKTLSQRAGGFLAASLERFGDLLVQSFPYSLHAKASKFLGLKTRTHPDMLAASLIEMSRILTQTLSEATVLAVLNAADSARHRVAEARVGDDVEIEILCALYHQSVAILGARVSDDEASFIQLYSAETFHELRKQLPATSPWASIQDLSDETFQLYFNDRPTLAELARKFSEYTLQSEVKEALEANSWMTNFAMKAEIRILARIGARSEEYALHLFLRNLILKHLFRTKGVFEGLRPVLD